MILIFVILKTQTSTYRNIHILVKKLETSKVSEVNSPDFDYVVIFDDGEEYNNYVNYFTEVGVKLRVIKIAITRVINIKTEL